MSEKDGILGDSVSLTHNGEPGVFARLELVDTLVKRRGMRKLWCQGPVEASWWTSTSSCGKESSPVGSLDKLTMFSSVPHSLRFATSLWPKMNVERETPVRFRSFSEVKEGVREVIPSIISLRSSESGESGSEPNKFSM
jgi:hypothetical protein